MRRSMLLAVPAVLASTILVAGCNDSTGSHVAKATTQPTQSAQPSPSATPVDSPAETATPSDGTGAMPTLLADSFDDNQNQWGEKAPDIQLADGSLVFSFSPNEALTDAPTQYPVAIQYLSSQVVSADVDFQDQQGVAGVTCLGDAHASTGYILYVRTDGTASIGRYHPDENGALVEDGLSDDVNASNFNASGVNTLAGTCTRTGSGEHLSLSVNGQQVVSADDTDSPLTHGIPGVAAQAAPNPPNNGNFVVSFDNFTVKGATA